MMKTERSKSVRMLPESVSGLIGISMVTLYYSLLANGRRITNSECDFVALSTFQKRFVNTQNHPSENSFRCWVHAIVMHYLNKSITSLADNNLSKVVYLGLCNIPGFAFPNTIGVISFAGSTKLSLYFPPSP